MSRCRKDPRCLMHDGHADACGTLAELPPLLVAVAKKQGTRLANWAASKVLDLVGYEGPR